MYGGSLFNDHNKIKEILIELKLFVLLQFLSENLSYRAKIIFYLNNRMKYQSFLFETGYIKKT